jgi:hypothetical protein
MTAMLTVSIWHNVTRDPEGRHAGFGGFTPGDQMVKVFTYDTPAGGRSPVGIADDAFAACNDAPRSGEAAALARQYRQRRLRSLSFPGKLSCCPRSCCTYHGVVLLPGRLGTDQPRLGRHRCFDGRPCRG